MCSFYGTRTHNPLLESFAVCVFMVEDVGFEPRFKLPKLACYHYTTSSIIPDSPSGLATLLCIQYVRPLAILSCGAHSWIRTSDLRVISTLLYRLSYASIFMIMKSKLFIIILYHIFFKKSNNFF